MNAITTAQPIADSETAQRIQRIKDAAAALPMPTPNDCWTENQEAAKKVFYDLAPLDFNEFLAFHALFSTKAGHSALGKMYASYYKRMGKQE